MVSKDYLGLGCNSSYAMPMHRPQQLPDHFKDQLYPLEESLAHLLKRNDTTNKMAGIVAGTFGIFDEIYSRLVNSHETSDSSQECISEYVPPREIGFTRNVYCSQDPG